MSASLSEFLEDDAPVVRPVSFMGKTIDVHFRRISAVQKSELMKGQKVQAVAGQRSTFEIDLGENAKSKMLLVFYSVANSDGSQYFKKLDQVRNMDDGKLNALYVQASDVNKEDLGAGEDPGKA